MNIKFIQKNLLYTGTLIITINTLHLREWNGIKGIFLEYSSLLLFGSFNGGNGMFILLFESLRLRLGGGNGME